MGPSMVIYRVQRFENKEQRGRLAEREWLKNGSGVQIDLRVDERSFESCSQSVQRGEGPKGGKKIASQFDLQFSGL